MKNLNMTDLRENRFYDSSVENLFIASLKTGAADEAFGVLKAGGKWQVKDICAAIPTKVSIQRMTNLLRALVVMGMIKREEVKGEKATASCKRWNGEVYTWEYTPTTAYYSIA